MVNSNRLAEIMCERRLTYRQLSFMSSISYSAIQKIANFERNPTQATMIAIAKALSLSVLDVFHLHY